MKISIKWIKKYLNIKNTLNTHEIINILSKIGYETKKIINENVIDLEITQDKLYYMNHYGISKELFAKLKIMNYKINFNKKINNKFICNNKLQDIKIQIKDKKNCFKYLGVILSLNNDNKNFKIKKYITQELIRLNINIENNIIDIINFIKQDLGYYINIYDADKINYNKIIIQKIQTETKLFISKKKYIKIPPNETVILDEKNKIISLPGVINNFATKVTNYTKNIFLESIHFNTQKIKQNIKKYNLDTLHSNYNCYNIINKKKFCFIIKKIYNLYSCQIVQKTNIQKKYINKLNRKKYLFLYYKKIQNILGVKLNKDIIIKIIKLIDIKIIINHTEGLYIKIPNYKLGISRDIDVINEIIRIYGYDNIYIDNIINSCIDIKQKIQNKKQDNLYKLENNIIYYLNNNGFFQLINDSFNQYDNYEFNKLYSIKLINPKNEKFNFLRTNMLENLINSINYNISINNFNLKFFEIGNIFFKLKKNIYKEQKKITLIITKKKTNSLFFYIKNVTYLILKLSKIKEIDITQHISDNNNLLLKYKKKNIIATIGYLNNQQFLNKPINQIVLFSDINLNVLKKIYLKSKLKTKNNIYVIKKDISIIANNQIIFEKIKNEIYKIKIKNLFKIKLIDIYKGSSIPENTISYTIRLYLQNKTNTIKIDKIIKKIINNLSNNKIIKIRTKYVVPAGLEPATS